MIISYLRINVINNDMENSYSKLDEIGIKFDKNYIDKCTIKNNLRPELEEMINNVSEEDTVYCYSLNTLGKSLKEVMEIIDILDSKGVRVVFIKEDIDTTNDTYDILKNIFESINLFNKESRQEKIIHTIDKLKDVKVNTGKINTKSGKWFGREQKTVYDLPKEFSRYYYKMINKEISKVEMSKILGVGRATLYRWIKLYEEAIK